MAVLRPPLFFVIAALAFCAQAHAQVETPSQSLADAAPPVAEEALSPDELAFNERAAALGQRVLAVDEEMKSAARLAALDPVGAKEDLDELQASFQTEMDAFIQDFLDFAAGQFATLSEEELADKRRIIENNAGQLMGLPQAMRERAEAAALLPQPPSQAVPPAN